MINHAPLRLAGLAMVLCAFSSCADAFQHHGAQSRPDHPSAWNLTFPPGVSTVEVPFHDVQGMIAVDVKVNGAGPFAFIIESGWSSPSLLITEDRDKMDFNFSEGAQGRGKNMHGPLGRRASDVQLEIGDLRIEGVDMDVASRDDEEFLAMMPEEGVLGVRFLAHVVVEVDWQRMRVRFHDPSTYEAPAEATPVPLTFRKGLVFASGEVTVDGATQPIKFIVDTGSAGTLLMRADRVAMPKRRISGIKIGQSLYGPVTGDIGRIDEFRFGGAIIKGMVTQFLDGASNMVAVGADGNLGNGVLRRFRVTFDYARERMLLMPTEAIAEPFPFTTSGIRVAKQIADDGTVGVAHVYAGSPAARAGLTTDDRIVSVDAQPVRDLGLKTVRNRLKQTAGTRVTLRIRGTDTERDVELELADII